MADNKPELTVKVSSERINSIPLETFYHLDDSPKAPVDYVAHFVVGPDGDYLPHKEAVALVLAGRTLGDVRELVDLINESAEENAVPN